MRARWTEKRRSPRKIPCPKTGGYIPARELPAVDTMTCVVRHGSFASVGRAYSDLMAWIEGKGCRILGPHRELFMRGGEQDNPDYVTKIQFPVETADLLGEPGRTVTPSGTRE